MSTERWLKGSNFQNRYKITGILTTLSPLHIGSGEELPSERRLKLSKTQENADEKKQKGPKTVSGVAVNFDGKPYLPGSALRGNLRSWLLHIFRTLPQAKEKDGFTLAWDHDIEELGRDSAYEDQEAQIIFMKESASVLERLFGTSFAASKLDVWDAPCMTSLAQIQVPEQIRKHPDHPPYWDEQRFTYVTQSVAIDPETGASAEKKLYHFELVPKGISFQLTLAGQNLTDEELGMILFALQGFNSQIFPVTLGAMAARGFGRFKWELQNIHALENENDGVQEWIKQALIHDHAGFHAMKPLGQRQDEYISKFKKAFQNTLGVSDASK